MHLTVNALFFNDKTMHKIYLDEGNYNFIYQIPQILYSSVLSGILNAVIKFLALTQKNFIKIKQEKEFENLIKIKNSIIKNLRVKFISFFIISFLLIVFCFYYISCFCGIYINTQIHLIKDSIISFSGSLIYPFGIYLIPGIFRLFSLKTKKPSHELLYKFSKLLQLI